MNNFSTERQSPPQETVEEHILKIESDFESVNGEKYIVEVDKDAPGLFLFDIDGTIIDAKKVHKPAILSLFEEEFGTRSELDFSDPAFRERLVKQCISHWGLGDRQEFEYTCRDLGINFSSDEEKEQVLDRMVANYATKIEENIRNSTQEEREAMFLPGVLDFLKEMKKRKIPAALVTGNTSRSAKAFAKYIGFGEYFITGGYDDDEGVSDTPYRRGNILKSSIEKCRAKGIDFTPEQMAVFGDTPKDFEATLHQGETRPYALLFATGDHSFRELGDVASKDKEKKPHLIIPSFTNIKVNDFFDSLDSYRKK